MKKKSFKIINKKKQKKMKKTFIKINNRKKRKREE